MRRAVPPSLAHLDLAQLFSALPLGLILALVALVVLLARLATRRLRQRFAEQHARQEQASQQRDLLAQQDPVTLALNGPAFVEQTNRRLAALDGTPARLALLVVDLDHFKRVNDSLGHHSGDLVLQRIAQRLATALPADTPLARFTSDEFCALVVLDTPDDLPAVAERLLAQLRPPIGLEPTQLRMTASIGAALYPDHGTRFETLFSHAGLAVGQCKAAGGNRFLRFDPRQEEQARETLSLEHELRQALNESRLGVHYQPIVDSRTGQVTSLEALVRWQHPRLGELAPERFVKLAEQFGLIADLDEWVTRRACKDLRLLQQAGFPELRVAVNTSALNLADSDLPATMARILDETGTDPARLTLEVTENALIHDLGTATAVLEAIRRLGIKVSIDDFGTGYSSLAYLSRLPVDTLKVDRSFVNEVHQPGANQAIATAIIAMAHKLGLKVVAEGVEQDSQRQFLHEQGCDMFQGFLFSQALPPRAVFSWLAAHEQATASPDLA